MEIRKECGVALAILEALGELVSGLRTWARRGIPQPGGRTRPRAWPSVDRASDTQAAVQRVFVCVALGPPVTGGTASDSAIMR